MKFQQDEYDNALCAISKLTGAKSWGKPQEVVRQVSTALNKQPTMKTFKRRTVVQIEDLQCVCVTNNKTHPGMRLPLFVALNEKQEIFEENPQGVSVCILDMYPSVTPLEINARSLLHVCAALGITRIAASILYFEISEMEKFEELLNHADWYFEMSDDPKARRRGQKKMAELRAMHLKLNNREADALWEKYAPAK